MKKESYEKCTVLLFVCFLAVMGIGLLLPKKNFSEAEKRYLEPFPEVQWEAISSGRWGDALETYFADHIPGRTAFVGTNAYYERFLGQQNTKEIRVLADRLVEAPAADAPAAVQKNLRAINAFADAQNTAVTLALIPSAGWALGADGYTDDRIIENIFSGAGDSLHTLELTDVFSAHPEWFYRTDHHWTSRGAYAGYAAIAAHYGKEIRPIDGFTVECIPDSFRGSTYSRSALWLTGAEDLELWHGSEAVTCTMPEHPEPASVFFRERLDEADKYTVFLDGNHPFVRLTNPTQTGKLLVIRDSFSNCLGPFLAESWGEVVLVDLRYYRQPVSELLESEPFDDVLILYSIGNFLTDANIIRLR